MSFALFKDRKDRTHLLLFNLTCFQSLSKERVLDYCMAFNSARLIRTRVKFCRQFETEFNLRAGQLPKCCNIMIEPVVVFDGSFIFMAGHRFVVIMKRSNSYSIIAIC